MHFVLIFENDKFEFEVTKFFESIWSRSKRCRN